MKNIDWSKRLREAADHIEKLENSTDFAVLAFGLSTERTGLLESLLLWCLYHHQGQHDPIGQPIRQALGMGQHEILSQHMVDRAMQFGDWENENSNN